MRTEESMTEERRIRDDRLGMDRLPRHIAIIMDGNGRWADRHGKRKTEGHEAGARGVRQVIEGCRELGVPVLTLYAFSTENWKRSKTEVSALFRLMSKYIHKEIDEIDQQNIRVRFLGRMEGLPRRAQKDLQYCLDRTAANTAMEVCVALNYGSRMEITDAARRIAEEAKAGRLDPAHLTEEDFARYLYVPEHSEVDLLIRTSAEQRISNFLLWQISYAEFLFPEVLWPDFTKTHLCDAIAAWQARDRRFGGRP
jgi:undecaprenyl diphosphate synthase